MHNVFLGWCLALFDELCQHREFCALGLGILHFCGACLLLEGCCEFFQMWNPVGSAFGHRLEILTSSPHSSTVCTWPGGMPASRGER